MTQLSGNKFSSGFTLIELLVVIAIIGILSSVVLASLNTARNKGADATVKSNLDNMRSQAELYYDNNGLNGYAGVCAGDPTFVKAMASAHTASGATTADTTTFAAGEATTNGACQANASSWAMSYPLKAAGGYYCVDSSGFSGRRTNLLGALSGVCPSS